MTWLVVFCSLVFVLGLIMGMITGIGLGRRAAESAEDEADQYVGQLLEPPEVARESMWEYQAARNRELASQTVQLPVLLPPEIHHDDLSWECISAEVAHEAWIAHEEQALALAAPETDEEFSARLARIADEIIAWAGEQAYLAGEHWKRP